MLSFFFTQAREFLSKLGDLSQTHIFAKIENVEVGCLSSIIGICLEFDYCANSKVNIVYMIVLQGLTHFDEILQEADGIILSRGNLGIDLPPEKVWFVIWTFF